MVLKLVMGDNCVSSSERAQAIVVCGTTQYKMYSVTARDRCTRTEGDQTNY